MLLSQPCWLKGGEFGVNKYVAIANEALFVKNAAKQGTLGMEVCFIIIVCSGKSKKIFVILFSFCVCI